MVSSALGTSASTASSIGEIGGEHMDPVHEIGCEGIERLAPGSRYRHHRALGMERAGDRPADTPGRPGHQRGLAGQIEHLPPPLPLCS